MKIFDIYGDIVDSEFEKACEEDVCPKDVKQFLRENENEEIELHINSCGGSVQAGVSIANMITHHKGNTVAVVDGLAASIASVIACACNVLKMGKSSFLLVHQVWGAVQGNSDDLRKEADTMEKMSKSLLAFYHRKFDLTDEELMQLLKNETWISGSEAENYKLNAVIDDGIQEVKYAAKLIQKIKNNFTNKDIIERFNDMEKPEETIEENSIEEKKMEENPVVEEIKEEPTEETKEEVKEAVEEIKEEKEEEKLEEIVKRLTEENESLKKQLDECTKKLNECKEEDVEKRVSGMQSKMQNKINTITNDFKNEIEKKDKELSEMKNQVSSLAQKLEQSTKELSEMTQSFVEKETALTNLNASVLTPSKEINFKDLHGKEFFDWVKNNNIR